MGGWSHYIDKEIKNNPGVYSIKSKIDKRVYIGIGLKVRKRLINHVSYLKRGSHKNLHLQSFVNKYGIESIELSVIEYCNQYNLLDREKYWVRYYNSRIDGFNFTDGGDSHPMTYDGVVEKCMATRMKNGRVIFIYAYDPQTGELIFSGYTYKKTQKRFGVSAPEIAGALNGRIKVCHGIHFSRTQKSPEQVLNDVIPNYLKPEHRKRISEMQMGEKNASFGIKRPDVAGDNNPFKKMILNGYELHRMPKKLKITEQEIIDLNNKGISNIEIAKKAGCGQCNIGIILRKNGIFLGKGKTRHGKKILKAA